MLANLFGTSNAVSSSTGNGRTPPVNKQRSDHHHHSQPTNGTQYARGGTAARSVTAPMRGSSQSTEIFNQPPRKVIRATRDYKAQFVNELEFVKGDFFFVITDLDDFYYEAMNPIARVRGLVPRSHFESLDKIAAGTQYQQQPPAPPSAAATAPAPESPLEFLQNQLNLRQQQQQREPPSRDRDRDRDHQRAYDSLHRYPTTTSTTTAAKPISGMGGRLPHPVSAHVQTDTMLPDGRFQYTIELHLSDDTSRVLLRVFDDFYTLHVSLLSQFAAQSGRLRDQPRSIPFLPPAPVTPKPFNSAAQAAAPPAQVTPAEQARRRRALDAYLTDLVALPAPIRHSPPLNRFFMQRKGDNTLATAVRFDTSAALMDLISDYNSYPSLSRNGGKTSTTATKSLTALPTPLSSLDLLDDHFVRIKLHLPSGDETLAWRIDEAMPFMDFVDEVAAKTRWRMRDGWAMWYKDEVGGLVKLTGESDWRLVVRGRWEKVVLYID
ncbi:hypothetical protein BDZ88DRAFT_395637 [Geranomyces variabilis]|nr:hypothetical protein BDZ88DRAFT_395637 [Geranomyces variabilis]